MHAYLNVYNDVDIFRMLEKFILRITCMTSFFFVKSNSRSTLLNYFDSSTFLILGRFCYVGCLFCICWLAQGKDKNPLTEGNPWWMDMYTWLAHPFGNIVGVSSSPAIAGFHSIQVWEGFSCNFLGTWQVSCLHDSGSDRVKYLGLHLKHWPK